MLKTTHITIYGVNALFSKTMFKICFVRESSDSSMEKFLNIQRVKKESTFFAPEKITCVYGKPGIGKTYFVNKILENYIQLDHEVLKSRQTTLDFFERLKYTNTPVVIDNWESICDLVGVREINSALSKGPTVIISHEPVDIQDVLLFPAPILSTEELTKITGVENPQLDNGDLRSFLIRTIYKTDHKDIHESPLDLIKSMFKSEKPIEYLHRSIHEHGYTMGVIQENYVDAKKISIEECADISDSLGLADIYDTIIYRNGAWDTLMPYFIISGCVSPVVTINGRLDTKKLRPGSVWSKFQNICMRLKKIESTGLSRDCLTVIRKYIEHSDLSILKDYKMDPSAIDILNHLGKPKLRPKLVEQAKKILRS